jgi:hypothetical protein
MLSYARRATDRVYVADKCSPSAKEGGGFIKEKGGSGPRSFEIADLALSAPGAVVCLATCMFWSEAGAANVGT